MALGEVDYGLMGVVGGLTAFIVFFFNIMSGAVGRFYAIAIGKASVATDMQAGLEECRKWFSLAVSIHLVVPVAIVLIGYPIGVWAVENFLTIPPDRVNACLWVFRFVCVSSFLGMVSVPFNAMYGAKQYIAELTIYSFVTSTLNVVFVYYMVSHPGVWLVQFALWTCLLSVIPQAIIATRACWIFPECKFRLAYAWNWQMYKEMLSYTGWNIFGTLGYLLKGQGISVLVNKYFGPRVNASMAIANTVSAQTMTLTGAVQGAFSPVITTAVGAGDFEKVRATAFRFCKFGMSLCLLFMLPLAIELPEVMRLWLKNPPQYVTGLCMIMILIAFIDQNTLGHGVAVMAKGEIKWYQIILGTFNLLALPIAWMFCALGLNVYYVGLGVLIAWSFLVYGRLYFARKLIGMSIRHWLLKIMVPIAILIVVVVSVGYLPHLFMAASLGRVFATTACCEFVMLPLLWYVVLDGAEREFVSSRVRKVFHID